MTEKKYVLGICAIVFGIALLAWVLAWVMPEERYMDGEYAYWKQQKDYTLQKGDEREILFLGDSRTKMGLIPELFDSEAYNIALGGGTPIEMYYTMQRYLQNHPKPYAVIAAFGPIHYTDIESYAGRDMYFRYLDKTDAEAVNLMLKEDGFPEIYGQMWKYYYRFPDIYLKAIVKSLVKGQTKNNQSIYNRIVQAKGRMQEGSDITRAEELIAQEANKKEFISLNTHSYYMEQIVHLCRKNNIPIVIEQLPLGSKSLQKMEAKGYLKKYQDYLRELSLKCSVDIEDVIPAYGFEEFQDGSHLNQKGAERFTASLREKYRDRINEWKGL